MPQSRLTAWCDRVGALSDLQGGFRAGRSTLDQYFVLTEVAAMHKERGLPLYMAFIDVRKAYDRVWRPGLWYKLGLRGLSPRFLRLLQTMYKSVTRSVQVNSQLTSRFNVDLGVPQGAVLSPTLYALYIDGLHQALRRSGLVGGGV